MEQLEPKQAVLSHKTYKALGFFILILFVCVFGFVYWNLWKSINPDNQNLDSSQNLENSSGKVTLDSGLVVPQFPMALSQASVIKDDSYKLPVSENFNVAAVVPAVVQINCFFSKGVSLGSGSFMNQKVIVTNAHVVKEQGELTRGCLVYFPENDGVFYKAAYVAEVKDIFDDKEVNIDVKVLKGIDVAFLSLIKPAIAEDGETFAELKDAHLPSVEQLISSHCGQERKIAIGEEIFVLGYPKEGGKSLTVTDGIISGFEGEFGELIKTSAKVDEGNSGGLAVLATDGCLLGIPTMAVGGKFESLSRILSYGFLSTYVGMYREQQTIKP